MSKMEKVGICFLGTVIVKEWDHKHDEYIRYGVEITYQYNKMKKKNVIGTFGPNPVAALLIQTERQYQGCATKGENFNP